MIQRENWQEPRSARFMFDNDTIKVIKSGITSMRSSINRLEQEFTKQGSFINGLQFDEIVKLHNYLGLFFSVNCSLLERVSDAEHELSNYLNKYL